ncbi:hypothetical protein AUJ83_00600 [Candidatus Woesearchaeota archaeon CG1_02_33_12]|nr:MAG: hypothetical protein AUJ83_00600 [Candidatus Woesearchaeota archaeon CG1_02_33_12]
MPNIRCYITPSVYYTNEGKLDVIKHFVISLLGQEDDTTKYEIDRKDNYLIMYRLRKDVKTAAWAVVSNKENKKLYEWVKSLGY